MTLDYEVNVKGPIFDGSVNKIMRQVVRDIQDELGDLAVDMVYAHFDAVLQNPTGYLRSRVHARRDSDDMTVGDGGVVYGPWIEGVSTRNQTTRFKGYHTYAKVTAEIDQKVEGTCDKVLGRYLR